MTARTTMSDIISVLRGMCNAGSVDYSVGSSAYWTDDQLQAVLDRYSMPVYGEQLTAHPITVSGGTVQWMDYESQHRYFEETDGGTAVFIVKNSTGEVQGTANWTMDYATGRLTFGTSTGGSAYFVDGKSYDVYAAAADVWFQKAAHAVEMIDFSTDRHNIKRSHIAEAAMQMGYRYQAMATMTYNPPASTERGDMNVHRSV